MKKCDILIISSEFPPGPGGIGAHAFSIANTLSKREYKVTVFCSGDYASCTEIDDFDKKQNFNTIRFKREVNFIYYRRIIQVTKFINQSKVKNVILSGKFSLWLGIIFKLSNLKLNTIAFLHGSEVNLPNWFLRKLTHLSIASIDILFAVSEFTKNLVPEYIRSKKIIHILENGLENDLLKKCKPVNIHLQGYPSLLTVGNVTPRKGQQRVIKALPEIIKIYPNAHYHIVGLTTNKNDFLDIANENGVENHVTFWGRANNFDELAGYYNAADVFCILSENQKNGDVEGFGIVVLEANYFKLPAIGAKGCGVEAAIKDNYNGYLVNGDNQQEIALHIQKVLENRVALANNAKIWADEHNWDNMITKLIKFIK